MEKLVKINSIKNYRFFQEYKRDTELTFFKKNNIISGWNGSGKSTLGDFFHMIEKGLLEVSSKFELSLQEENNKEKRYSDANINDLKNRFKKSDTNNTTKLKTNPSVIITIELSSLSVFILHS